MKARILLMPIFTIAMCGLSACAVSPQDLGGRLDGHVWDLFAGGNIAGADIAHDLHFGSASPQVELEGSANVWRNRFAADWAHLDRSESGQASGTFTFQGQPIPFSSHIRTHVDADIVRGTYGFVIGPKTLSVTPMLGASYVRQDTSIVGTGTPTILSGVPAGVPVQAEQKDSQPFPIAGVRADAIPIEWLDLAGQVAGFGIPQGHIVDGQATMGFRLYHGRIDVGYRYIRFDFGDTTIRLKGIMFGGGVYF
jgi:hypothetical protein